MHGHQLYSSTSAKFPLLQIHTQISSHSEFGHACVQTKNVSLSPFLPSCFHTELISFWSFCPLFGSKCERGLYIFLNGLVNLYTVKFTFWYVVLKFDECLQLCDGHHNEGKMMLHFLNIHRRWVFVSHQLSWPTSLDGSNLFSIPVVVHFMEGRWREPRRL